jgi:hypothetical protein
MSFYDTGFWKRAWISSKAHILTLEFIVPQSINLLGSVLFARLLSAGSLSVAIPLTNGVSIVSNALVDYLLGDGVTVWPGLPGVMLVLVGSVLCST